MERIISVMVAVFLVLAVSLGGMADFSYAKPHIQLPPSDVIDASKKDVSDIQSFYDKIETAMQKEDLKAIMAFYADDYFHRGITKSQVEGLWKNIFERFDNLNSVHIFSSVLVQDTEAVLKCTGTLFGTVKGATAKNYVEVDRWVNTDHFLSKIDGKWQIVGGATHWLHERKVLPDGVIDYQLEFHPLF